MADVPFVEGKEIPCLCGGNLDFIYSDVGVYVGCSNCDLATPGGGKKTRKKIKRKR